MIIDRLPHGHRVFQHRHFSLSNRSETSKYVQEDFGTVYQDFTIIIVIIWLFIVIRLNYYFFIIFSAVLTVLLVAVMRRTNLSDRSNRYTAMNLKYCNQRMSVDGLCCNVLFYYRKIYDICTNIIQLATNV